MRTWTPIDVGAWTPTMLRTWKPIIAALSIAACAPTAQDSAPDGPYRIASTIEVGGAPHGIRFSASGDTAYVALSGEGRIAVVDLESNQVVETWDAGSTPLDLIQTSSGWLVSQFRDSVLIALDLQGRIVPDDQWGVGAGPSLFTPGSVGGTAWITSEFGDQIWIVDLEAGAPSGFLPTGDRPYPADVMWDGSYAFVPNLEDGTVSVIDLLNVETDATVEVCPGPPGGALTRDQVSYVVACGGSSEVAFINTASFAVTRRISEGLGERPFSAVAPRLGGYILVNNAGGSTVSVIDPEAGIVVQQIDVGEKPILVREHPDGVRVFVSNEDSGTLVVLELVGPDAGSRSRDAVSRVSADASRSPGAVSRSSDDGAGALNEVIVMGMIHSGHETSEAYSLEVVRDLVRAIDPDYWLPEIAPNRWDRALAEFEADGEVQEPRVRRFPEYLGALFPLTRELDFEVIPTAGWTAPMSDHREVVMDAYSKNPDRVAEWAEYQAANAAADAAIEAGGGSDDPRWIHTDAYDDAYEIRLSTYNRLFNDEIGPGGWDNINTSHYALISAALDRHRGEGARFLITYGAGHKGWFLRELRARDDIRLLEVAPFLDEIGR